jgi:hypothetical protein
MRRLYAGVVRAKLHYGAPIWARELMDRRRSLQLVSRLHRTVAIRVVRGYRTISAAAAAVLQILRCREIYLHTRSRPEGVGGRAGACIRTRARQALLDIWRSRLDTRTGAPGLRVVETVLPHWGDWLDGSGPPLTYRVTQVFIGHGCFGEYLCRIRRETTARCHHCDWGGGGGLGASHAGGLPIIN